MSRLPLPLLFSMLVGWACLMPFWPMLSRAQDPPPYPSPLFTGPYHEALTPPYELDHLHLSLRLNPERGEVVGTARYTLRILTDTLSTFRLQAHDLRLDSVSLLLADTLRKTLPFTIRPPDTLLVSSDTTLVAGNAYSLEFAYAARPRRGLHATKRGDDLFLWTADTPGSHAHWMPVFPSACDRYPVDLDLTVPDGIRVETGGTATGSIQNDDGTSTYRFTSAYPLCTRQLGLAAGPFEDPEGVLPPGARVGWRLAVAPAVARAALLTWAPANDVVHFLTDYLRYPFPTATLTWAAVPDLYSGESAAQGLLVFDEAALLDERALPDFPPDTMLARRLATQWFGTLVASSFPTDRWLDLSVPAFIGARYAAERWDEEAMRLHMEGLLATYLEEANRYRRPLVWDQWEDPSQMDDAHSAAKGAWVLYMIQKSIGDDAFRRTLNRYLYANDRAAVDTEALRRALEAETGRSWSSFFDRWVYAAGHPILAVTYTYDPGAGSLRIRLRQVQEGPLIPDVFRGSLSVEVATLGGVDRHTVPLDRRERTFTFPLAMPPRYIVVDADHTLLAELRVEQPVDAWVAQLRLAESAVHRLRAAMALRAHLDHPDLLFGLRSALRHESTPAVREAIVKTIGSLPPSPRVERVLLDALTDSAASVRAAALQELGAYTGSEDVAREALRLANQDRSYPVQAAAVATLARIGAPSTADVIRSALVTPSYQDLIRVAAVRALPLLGPSPRETLNRLRPFTAEDQPFGLRLAALDALEALITRTPLARRHVLTLAGDRDPRIRKRVLHILQRTLEPGDRALLLERAQQETEPDLLFRLRQLLSSLSPPP